MELRRDADLSEIDAIVIIVQQHKSLSCHSTMLSCAPKCPDFSRTTPVDYRGAIYVVG